MAKSRFEMRVGVFVLIGLVLLGALTLLFSKGVSFDWDVYRLNLRASTVGGLQPRASVLMSGVRIGSVSAIKLERDGKSVVITLKIDKRIPIYPDARFVIEQSGFLGDQYVAVIPTQNLGDPLREGAEVACAEPFNMLEVARNASGLIMRIDDATKKLDAAIGDIRKYVLNDQTLSNFSATIGNLREFSEDARLAMDSVSGFVTTNAPPLEASISNLVFFSEQMSRFSGALNELADTNRIDITAAIRNVRSSTDTLKSVLDDLEAGKGLAGGLLKNEALATHVSLVASNLAVTSSNLNRRGLWGILWAPKPPRTNAPAKASYPGRNPFND